MKVIQTKSDTDLLDLLRKGDERAFEELFTRYWKQAHNFVKMKVISGEVAKEIVQEVFTDLWDHRKERQIHHFSGYLFMALKYKSIKHIERLIVQKKYWDHCNIFTPRHGDQTQHDVDYSILSDALEEGLNNLTEKTQIVFRLSRMEGRSISEISKSMNLTEKAIEYHLTKSIKELRTHLKDYNLSVLFFLFGCCL